MSNLIKYVIWQLLPDLRMVGMTIGLLVCATLLHAQYKDLMNRSIDFNHGGRDLPTFFGKDSATGSPYLVKGWLRGFVDLTDHRRVPASGQALFFNYDKMNERLVATDGISKTWVYSNDSISSFVLTDSNSIYYFEKIPRISPSHFLQPLVKSETGYSLYKRVFAKYIPADYRNEGYYTTGKRFDQYSDRCQYYIVYPGGQTSRELNLNERAIKRSLRSETSRLDRFFSKDSAPLDERKFVELIEYLNDQRNR